MSTQPAAPPEDAVESGGPAAIPAAERGATVIPDKVVARIAVRAAREAMAGLADSAAGRSAAPRVSVTTGDGAARLGLSIDLPYPSDLTGSALHVQEYVGARVSELTGMRVSEVTLVIEHLLPFRGMDDRRVQ
ncbi:Asp23/Gls24 family envelope stress response protein [Streptomyces sp. cmx-4-9]|uniref:Asp23/Gls24 family envelope stress response protein n=1 Tax=Streptomyces sp. cmx-4-9 TaxID=2790941 RepID=UPI0039805DEF